MCEGMGRWGKRLKEEGRLAGLQAGIQTDRLEGMLLLCKDLGMGKEEAMQQIQKSYPCTKEQLNLLFENNWKEPLTS